MELAVIKESQKLFFLAIQKHLIFLQFQLGTNAMGVCIRVCVCVCVCVCVWHFTAYFPICYTSMSFCFMYSLFMTFFSCFFVSWNEACL